MEFHLYKYKNCMYNFAALTNQIGQKYDLPVKSAFSASRGFYFQLSISSTSSADNVEGGSHHKKDMDMEDLPREFVKVTKQRNTFSFTTVDLIKLNSMFSFVVV